jgi:hypothetical protein
MVNLKRIVLFCNKIPELFVDPPLSPPKKRLDGFLRCLGGGGGLNVGGVDCSVSGKMATATGTLSMSQLSQLRNVDVLITSSRARLTTPPPVTALGNGTTSYAEELDSTLSALSGALLVFLRWKNLRRRSAQFRGSDSGVAQEGKGVAVVAGPVSDTSSRLALLDLSRLLDLA